MLFSGIYKITNSLGDGATHALPAALLAERLPHVTDAVALALVVAAAARGGAIPDERRVQREEELDVVDDATLLKLSVEVPIARPNDLARELFYDGGELGRRLVACLCRRRWWCTGRTRLQLRFL